MKVDQKNKNKKNKIRKKDKNTKEEEDTYYNDELVGDDENEQTGIRIVKNKRKRDK